MSESNCKPLPPLTEEDIQRFWKYVQKGRPDECWPWKRGKCRGYGMFGRLRAPRVAFYIQKRIDPFPYEILHSCDNPPCCNPYHLLLGTHGQNMKDAGVRGRMPTGSRHGSHKHPHLMKRGSDHGMSKLTEDAIREIRAARASGASLADLANTYGVGTSNISSIVLRQTWKHVT